MGAATDRQSIIDRVRACLNRGAGTSFEGEREASITAAKRLIDKYELKAREVGPLAHMVGLIDPPSDAERLKDLVDEAMRWATRPTYTYQRPADWARQSQARQRTADQEHRQRRAQERRQERARARTASGGRPFKATWTEGGRCKSASFATEENAWKWARKQGDRIQDFKVRVAA